MLIAEVHGKAIDFGRHFFTKKKSLNEVCDKQYYSLWE